MKTNLYSTVYSAVALGCLVTAGCAGPNVEISGELKQWHKVTLTLDGPEAAETGAGEGESEVNPFTDYAMTVTFAHESGVPMRAVERT